jgi:hypothetical protein
MYTMRVNIDDTIRAKHNIIDGDYESFYDDDHFLNNAQTIIDRINFVETIVNADYDRLLNMIDNVCFLV